MKVVVSKYLNARIGKASTNAICNFFRNPGDILDVADVLVGDELDANLVWYKSADDGCFYWSGGTQDVAESIKDSADFSIDDQQKIYRNAVNFFTPQFLEKEYGVKGIAAGFKEKGKVNQDSLTLIFYVTGKNMSAKQIPATLIFKGILLNTDVRATGKNSFHNDIVVDTEKPFVPGGSISQAGGGENPSYGSRGALVIYEGSSYLITCFHVACFSLFESSPRITAVGNARVKVEAPSTAAGSIFSSEKGTVLTGAIGSDYDFALIKMENVSLFTNKLDGNNAFNGYYKMDEIQKNFLGHPSFTKYGATAPFKKSGKLKNYHSEAVLVDDDSGTKMSKILELDKISNPGDSGGPVVDGNNKLLGFVIAGNDQSTYVLPFSTIASFSIDLQKE